MRRAHWQRACRTKLSGKQRVSLNAVEAFRANLSISAWICRPLLQWDASKVWMMRVSTVRAVFLCFVLAALPVVTLGKATVTNLMFINDLPLVLGIGILQHGTVGGRMIVGTAILGVPCTPTIMWFGRIVITS